MSEPSLIYIVDQSRNDCDELERILRGRGLTVEHYTSGEAAIEAAGKGAPALIMTSMGLKGMDGLQFVRALKADDALKDIPIILHTSARRVMNLPFKFSPDPKWFPVDAVVEKPVRSGYLCEVVDKALGR